MIRLSLLLNVLILTNFTTPAWAEQKGEPTNQDIYRAPVTIINVNQDNIEQHTRIQGVIEAISSPEIKTKISAEVVQVMVDEGDSVKTGQVLALLDDEGFRLDREAAKADIEQLKVLLENQQLTLKRDKALVRKNVIPESKLDDSSTAVRQTKARLNHAQVLLKKANYQLTHTRVLSPISGVIQQRSVSKGDYVNPMSPSGKPLFQIVDTDHLRARLYFPESLSHAIKSDMKVTLERGKERLNARITQSRPMLELQNRALHVLADFKNTKHWKPGETISADVVLKQHQNVIVIPENAIIRRPAGLAVYRLNKDKVEQVIVETGIRQDGKVEIVSGLKEGNQIVLEGAAYLTNNTPVEIKNANDDKESAK
jgi:RND family efflux transporter MFP subunit